MQTLEGNQGNLTAAQKVKYDKLLKSLSKNFAAQDDNQYIPCDGVVNPEFLPGV